MIIGKISLIGTSDRAGLRAESGLRAWLKLRLTRLVVAVCAAAVSLGSVLPADAAGIRGVVRFTGAMEEPRKVPMTIDQYVCGKEKDADDLVVGPQRGIRNAVVWLQKPPAGVAGLALPAKVEMDQKACVFVPRVVVVPVGGTVDFLNSDRLLHNLHSVAKDNPAFNRTQPRGRVIPVVFSKPEIVRVNCDLHSWMRASVVVANHPFYAVTNDAGEFTLADVPPGKYTLQIWHEVLGVTTRPVTVGDQAAQVTVDFKARP